MQITRQADYALRAMLYLAQMDPVQRASTSESAQEKNIPRASTSQIAQEKNIPPSFLAKIISQLSIAGLIHTSRGARGGVSLARLPEQISLLEVVEAIDGPISLNECTNNPDVCAFGDDCPLHTIWCATQAELVEKLRKTSFSQFVPVKD